MLRLNEIKLPLDHTEAELATAVASRVAPAALRDFAVFRRGYDARRPAILLIYTIDAEVDDEALVADARPTPDTTYRLPVQAPPDCERPVVIGAGPCGLFAGLMLARMGFRPIILDRGRVVRERTRDTWKLWRQSVLDPESNVQFGEGGAGTFSDGKLWSQVKDPGHRGGRVLSEFVEAGAPLEILTVSKPHVGTFRLVGMVEHMRATVERLGGEYRFGHRVTDLLLGADRQIEGLALADGSTLACRHVVLAIGHSARDTFSVLHARGVAMSAKPFSIGLRIEHPQSLIDRSRFGAQAGHKLLGAADYRLVHHCTNGRAVYSFCMCPGGTVVAAASEPGRVVTNGMSQYSRNERNANAAIVVDVTPADFVAASSRSENSRGHASQNHDPQNHDPQNHDPQNHDPQNHDPLGGVGFQREWEARAFAAGGGTYAAPAQLVGDFLAGRPSTALGRIIPSYRPGVAMTDLSSCLPEYVTAAIREALPVFGREIRGFDAADAVLTGVETRTSSPVRIGRGRDGQSLNTPGLYPAGEGAGYAGGILSAGIDGIKAAEAVAAAIAAGA